MTLLSLLLPIAASAAPATPIPVLRTDAAPVHLWMNNDGRFREGDYARVQVDAETDGFLLVLQYDPYGRLRILFPLDPRDDNRVQAGRRYEVRDDGGRYAFRADGDGPGLIYSAISPDPWRLDDVVRDDRWDYDRLSIGADSNDPEREITELVQGFSGPGGFDYDLQDYRVYGQSGNTTVVYRDYGYGYGGDPYRYCDWYWSYSGCRSLRFGLYYGYDPFYHYGYPSRYYPYSYPYYPRTPIVVRPRAPSAIVSGRPRNYTVTPLRPRGSVVAPSIDWRTRGNVRSPEGRPTARGANRSPERSLPTARPSRPRSERNDFRGEASRPEAGSRPAWGSRPEARSRPESGSRPEARSRPESGSRPEVRSRPESGSRPEVRSRPESGSRPEARSRPQPSRATPSRSGNSGRRESGNSGGQARGNSGGGRSGGAPHASRPRRP